jgi:hypothetical protein
VQPGIHMVALSAAEPESLSLRQAQGKLWSSSKGLSWGHALSTIPARGSAANLALERSGGSEGSLCTVPATTSVPSWMSP